MDAGDLLLLVMGIVRWGLLALAVVLALATLLAETRLPHWPARMWDFPRAQIAVICVAVAVLYPLATLASGAWSWWSLVVSLVMIGCAGRQATWIWPYVGPAENDLQLTDAKREDANAVKIIISNVLQENDDYERWRRVVKPEDADLIVCAETTEPWVREIGRLLDDSHPHRHAKPQDNYYGMAVWSRFPLDDFEVQHLVQDDIPSFHACLKLRDGQGVHIHCLHPRPPAPQEGDSSAPRDAELIVMANRIKEAREQGRTPHVVLGDLNDVAWSRTTDLFLKISGMLDPRRGRGLYNSFHAHHWWFRVPLDHIFVGPEFRLIEMRRLDDVGSDHFPMCITLSLEPDAEAEQRQEEADETDREEAREAVETQVEREQEGEEQGHLSGSVDAEKVEKDLQ